MADSMMGRQDCCEGGRTEERHILRYHYEPSLSLAVVVMVEYS